MKGKEDWGRGWEVVGGGGHCSVGCLVEGQQCVVRLWVRPMATTCALVRAAPPGAVRALHHCTSVPPEACVPITGGGERGFFFFAGSAGILFITKQGC